MRSERWVELSLIFVLVIAPFVDCVAQTAQTVAPPVQMTSEQDRQNMMDQLHISSLRPGADTKNPNSPNAVNYDESKANPYPKLPDPLILNNGKKVTTAKMWWNRRRPEIVEEFDREIYGRMPKDTPTVRWVVESTSNEKVGDIPVITKHLVGHVDNSADPAITVGIQLTLSTPANATGPVPVMMQFTYDPALMAALRRRLGANRPAPPPFPGPTWQEQVLAQGLGICHPHSHIGAGGQWRGLDAGHHWSGE